jgi:hypothetical protein
MKVFEWKARVELLKQLKFFKAKRQKFISCYAGKPRIRISAAVKVARGSVDMRSRYDAMVALHQDQLNMGMSRTSIGYQQMNAAQNAASQFSGGSGGSGGVLGGSFL